MADGVLKDQTAWKPLSIAQLIQGCIHCRRPWLWPTRINHYRSRGLVTFWNPTMELSVSFAWILAARYCLNGNLQTQCHRVGPSDMGQGLSFRPCNSANIAN